ncbi:2-polyprenyl-3-methyl-6-methoxy-1,4-benzoquinone monooxygenase [Ferribacterium limneticum]|uniref:2-polyprenyl-3-methyl-6-methoxy-1,4-benzoquinone monooxygenase n=1 Tax=Ferribacterium limneticum TaxID=76259 RepID=UPI001CFC07E3|nr:2-polyprenyl-3-methyl-6-methoxy-1,4-benzoquinone monooxygenase [Ferribacterium limneticum]UCV29181.1 2-polyprenyl-3-methyl-6-methoxy-1,4-benzoquinone monooxygenase [Ferribacterium limneticum]UCV33100.1 2-polyprenyl-3-methyl-6-methoxy-1,4-benzoquinone monooxygenase [Ferribacterium limneticum]
MSPDQFIVEFDRALRTVLAPARSVRPVPGSALPEAELDVSQKQLVVGLMRVNHCGEICAQALYQGQALTSRDAAIREALRGAADEETEHLAWTEQRISELGGRKSFLNPLWYLGSLTLGLAAGALGDKWNLGFLAETERQVEAHLDGHLQALPEGDGRSRAIVDQMRLDEIQHAETAVRYGAAELPVPAKAIMKTMAKVMTGIAYRI